MSQRARPQTATRRSPVPNTQDGSKQDDTSPVQTHLPPFQDSSAASRESVFQLSASARFPFLLLFLAFRVVHRSTN
eukprot:2531621-Rhodomonas_salina.4